MTIALTVPLADNWGMHGNGGWWLLAAIPMMLFMGAMMWMMMRGMMGGSSSPDSSAPSDELVSRETPMQTLERRFAEGEISIEEYRARREALIDAAAEPSGDEDDERLAAPRSGGG
jgi:putative membrane protein